VCSGSNFTLPCAAPDAYYAGRADALADVKRAHAMARTTSEYANGYNSGAWVSGRSEGFALAEQAIDGTLKPGQWSGES
jgi:hypothetical protein